MESDQDLWGEVEPDRWQSVAFTRGRPANERDVREGRAVFFVDGNAGPTSVPQEMNLPARAVLADEETGVDVPVIVIQAEILGENVAVGYRLLSGGNGVCTLAEIKLVDSHSTWLNE